MEAGRKLTITVDGLYTRIGKLEVEKKLLTDANGALERAVSEYRDLLSKTSRVAGEALKALQILGFEEIADAIRKGDPWKDPRMDAEEAEGGSLQAGSVAGAGLGEDGGGDLPEAHTGPGAEA